MKNNRKFNIGEFIINEETGKIAYVNDINDFEYVLQYEDLTESNYEFGFIDNIYKKWDIDDAYDGQVLYIEHSLRGMIFIFKSPDKSFFVDELVEQEERLGYIDDVSCYAWLDIYTNDLLVPEYNDFIGHSDEDIRIATPSEKDMIYKRLKENGFEWDDVNKEIKKWHK